VSDTRQRYVISNQGRRKQSKSGARTSWQNVNKSKACWFAPTLRQVFIYWDCLSCRNLGYMPMVFPVLPPLCQMQNFV